MPSKKIINQKFTVLRNWLFPGQIWDTAPPDRVSEELVSVVDTEHWVEVPRFAAHAASLAPGIGRAASVLFENYVRNPRGVVAPGVAGAIGTAMRTRFNITDIWVRLAFLGTIACSVETRRQYPTGSFVDPANLDYNQVSYLIPGDADPFVGIYTCDVAHPAAGAFSLNQAGDAYTWVPLPDLTPGNAYNFISTTEDAVMHLDFLWTERRPPGQPNISDA